MNMKKSVKYVLNQGQLTVNVPVFIFMFGIPSLILYLTNDGWHLPISFILSYIMAWTWWSFTIVYWRIWAFENTSKKDWSDLKYRAIEGKLIWPDGSWFEKTEIRSKAQKAKIEKINEEIASLERDF